MFADSRRPTGLRAVEGTLVISLAAALILLRSVLYLRFQQFGFDSDQAIVGLMAKHLVERRAFPLFFYGQSYMMAVEAWAAAPFFVLAGPTVTALRLSIVAWQIAFAAMVIKGLERDTGLRPWTALVPVLFFIAAPPSVASELMTAQGGIIEPFVYVVLLWFVRERPLWFGGLLAVGTLNREFTLYAIPALVAVEAFERRFPWRRFRHWLLVLVAFFAVWESVEALKPYADLMGPGTRGQLIQGFAGSQVDNLLNRFNWDPSALVQRFTSLGGQIIAWFAGASQVETGLPLPSHHWLSWAGAVFLMTTAFRLLVSLTRRDPSVPSGSALRSAAARMAPVGFATYLLLVGLVAIVVFTAGKPTMTGYARYVVLGLLGPIGLTAAVLRIEPRPLLRWVIVAAVIAWSALMVYDHTKLFATYIQHPPPDRLPRVANHLVDRHIAVAVAGYWRAYELSFLAREHLRVASSDFVRIQEYQDLLQERPDAIVIADAPCPSGEQVEGFYLCPQ